MAYQQTQRRERNPEDVERERTQLAIIAEPRLPMPSNVHRDDLTEDKWRVLVESTFPNAQSTAGVLLALDYCKARNLDILKKPVNIVSMYSSKAGKMVETIWPSINEIEITASRTGSWAGMDTARLGPMIDGTFTGRVEDWVDKANGQGREKKWITKEAKIKYPEWGEVTVYRMVKGVRCPFTERVYWIEAYSRQGRDTELPTAMWLKRPIGQFTKVCKAFSIRAAFPEEGEYTAEEMEGQSVEESAAMTDAASITPKAGPNVIEGKAEPQAESAGQPEQEQQSETPGDPLEPHAFPIVKVGHNPNYLAWSVTFIEHINAAKTVVEAQAWHDLNIEAIQELRTVAPKLFDNMAKAFGARKNALTGSTEKTEQPDENKTQKTSPQQFFTWLDERLPQITTVGALDLFINDEVKPKLEDLEMDDANDANLRIMRRRKEIGNGKAKK